MQMPMQKTTTKPNGQSPNLSNMALKRMPICKSELKVTTVLAIVVAVGVVVVVAVVVAFLTKISNAKKSLNLKNKIKKLKLNTKKIKDDQIRSKTKNAK